MTDLESKVAMAGLAVIGALAAALIKIVRSRNHKATGNGLSLSKGLITYIDERAAHKAANAAAPVLLEVGHVRQDLSRLRTEVGDRVDKVESKIDSVQGDVSHVREDISFMRGEMGTSRRDRNR